MSRPHSILHMLNYFHFQASSGPAVSSKNTTFDSTDSPSEGLRKLFYDNGDLNMPKKTTLPKDDTRNFIVNEMQLRQLLRHCPTCHSYCGEPVAESHGVDTIFHIDCATHGIVEWSTQQDMSPTDLNKGNLDVAASVRLGARNYEDLASIAAGMNLKIMSERTFYR